MAQVNSHLAAEKGAMVRRTILDAVIFAYLGFTVLAITGHKEADLIPMVPQLATIFLGVAVLGALVSIVVNKMGIKTLGWQIYAPPHLRMKSTEELATPVYKTFWGIQMLLAVGVTTLVGIKMTEIDIIKLLEADRFHHAMRLFGQLFTPDWSILPKALVKVVETIYIAFIATVIAIPIAFVLSFMMARNIMGNSKLGFAIYATLRTVFNVSRSIEPVLWAIIFSIWASFGPFAGMLALLVHSIASLAKQYSEIVEGIEDGPIEGVESTGASRLQVVWFAVVPQVVLP
ncbi:MAG: phosphonate ABC transporter, permease protein PhnE, partial [Bdellovibrionales bacterium]|nr:phosphonate ABC transporter, permease protein PhnE [Bdellovibrionales bacterium]